MGSFCKGEKVFSYKTMVVHCKAAPIHPNSKAFYNSGGVKWLGEILESNTLNPSSFICKLLLYQAFLMCKM
jgi:hypothetical protein